jgi:hypothetical protein
MDLKAQWTYLQKKNNNNSKIILKFPFTHTHI